MRQASVASRQKLDTAPVASAAHSRRCPIVTAAPSRLGSVVAKSQPNSCISGPT